MRVRPRFTVRLRLTLLYGGLFLAVGTILLAVNYFLVRRSINVEPSVLRKRIQLSVGSSLFSFLKPPLPDSTRLRLLLEAAAADLKATALHQLLIQSIIALTAMATLCLGIGWLVARRALRPLQRITGTAKHLSEATLHERIDLAGPRDELKELADSLDEMLARLDEAFASQRRFVANASHELRTPLSIIRAETDVALANPNPTVEELSSMAEVVRQATDRCERLLAGLLALARSESVMPDAKLVDLAAIVGRVLRERTDGELRITTSLESAEVRGDDVLLERVVENLVENAVRYNRPRGWVEVATSTEDERALVVVRNSGDVIPPEAVESLFEPFRRLDGERLRSDRGFGLGLAIVRAVVRAHGGMVTAAAPSDGGLEVTIDLPAAVVQGSIPAVETSSGGRGA